jgi:type II secretory pathway predicted ATPase ExeA
VVPIVDDAHLLDGDGLEELRCLSDADSDQAAPFTLILLG